MQKRPTLIRGLVFVAGLSSLVIIGCTNKTELTAVESLREMATRERQVSAELSREIKAHQERTAMDRVVIVIMGGAIAITCFNLIAR